MTEASERKLAKRLAIAVVEEGDAAIPRIGPLLEKILAGKSDADRKQFLKSFSKFLRREIARDTLTIVTASAASPASVEEITRDFQTTHPRKLIVQTHTDSSLIGGARIRLGDTIYDASLAGKLDALAAGIH